jgi:hypothetical protein
MLLSPSGFLSLRIISSYPSLPNHLYLTFSISMIMAAFRVWGGLKALKMHLTCGCHDVELKYLLGCSRYAGLISELFFTV